MSTTYSPRYEFVTIKFLTQIRTYRVYTEDRQIFLAQTFSSSTFVLLCGGCGRSAFILFRLVLVFELWEPSKGLNPFLGLQGFPL